MKGMYLLLALTMFGVTSLKELTDEQREELRQAHESAMNDIREEGMV